MRNFFVCLLFVSTFSYSQNTNFNLTNYKTYSVVISNLKNQEQAIDIVKNAEKSLWSEFAWIDFKTGIGYFINNNSMQMSNITSLINSKGLTCSNTKEINLDNNLFLEIYSNRSGLKSESLKNQPLNYINLGDQQKSELFYQIAKEIWIKKYPESYNALYNSDYKNDKEYMPEHYPVFVNTGNSEQDNANYENAKQEWIKNYPDEVEQFTKRSYQNSTGMEKPKEIETINSKK